MSVLAPGSSGLRLLRSERALVGAAALLSVGLAVFYVLRSQHLALRGDELEYSIEAWLINLGRWFWTFTPYGIAHASAWKAPGYPAWTGLWYWLFGVDPLAVRLAQTPLAGLDVVLAWLLARRLFGPRAGLATALLVAVYPLAWQFTGLLYPEALATPLYLGLALLILGGVPDRRRAVLVGLLLGVTLLVRPSSVMLLATVLVAWGVAAGWRRGLGLTVLVACVAALVVAPWTIRNAVVLHGFLPISLEDAAAYGTFNSVSANYSPNPYAWRPDPAPDAHLFDRRHPLSDIALHSALQSAALHYIEHHPASLPEAFFWNGITRLWDLRPRHLSYVEVPLEGRSGVVTRIGLDFYDVLLPLAVIGLWRLRKRRALVAALIVTALAASVVYTADAGTRYRAPFEPIIAMLACVGVLGG